LSRSAAEQYQRNPQRNESWGIGRRPLNLEWFGDDALEFDAIPVSDPAIVVVKGWSGPAGVEADVVHEAECSRTKFRQFRR
jgi:hypothetical protein